MVGHRRTYGPEESNVNSGYEKGRLNGRPFTVLVCNVSALNALVAALVGNGQLLAALAATC